MEVVPPIVSHTCRGNRVDAPELYNEIIQWSNVHAQIFCGFIHLVGHVETILQDLATETEEWRMEGGGGERK